MTVYSPTQCAFVTSTSKLAERGKVIPHPPASTKLRLQRLLGAHPAQRISKCTCNSCASRRAGRGSSSSRNSGSSWRRAVNLGLKMTWTVPRIAVGSISGAGAARTGAGLPAGAVRAQISARTNVAVRLRPAERAISARDMDGRRLSRPSVHRFNRRGDDSRRRLLNGVGRRRRTDIRGCVGHGRYRAVVSSARGMLARGADRCRVGGGRLCIGRPLRA